MLAAPAPCTATVRRRHQDVQLVATNAAGTAAGLRQRELAAAADERAVCTVTAQQSRHPFTGTSITLTASCNNSPTTTRGAAARARSRPAPRRAASAASVTYGVSATNIIGTSAAGDHDRQLAAVRSRRPTSAVRTRCRAHHEGVEQRPDVSVATMAAGSARTRCSVISITVPASAANASNKSFSASVTEYQGRADSSRTCGCRAARAISTAQSIRRARTARSRRVPTVRRSRERDCRSTCNRARPTTSASAMENSTGLSVPHVDVQSAGRLPLAA